MENEPNHFWTPRRWSAQLSNNKGVFISDNAALNMIMLSSRRCWGCVWGAWTGHAEASRGESNTHLSSALQPTNKATGSLQAETLCPCAIVCPFFSISTSNYYWKFKTQNTFPMIQVPKLSLQVNYLCTGERFSIFRLWSARDLLYSLECFSLWNLFPSLRLKILVFLDFTDWKVVRFFFDWC